MTKQQIENEKVVQICYDYLDNFRDFYPPTDSREGLNYEDFEMPDNVKLTVFCQSLDEEGFLVNVTTDEAGLLLLFVKKWIIHEELEKLAGRSLA